MNPELQQLGDAIFEAAEKAFRKLFENGEHYYYCVLLTTGEALPPCISAWSEEALERLVAQGAIPEDEIQYYKYSFADSPYYAFGDYAMKKLDEAGIFALNQPRAQVYINVELMPPDDTDIQRALSFNNLEHIKEWLSIFG